MDIPGARVGGSLTHGTTNMTWLSSLATGLVMAVVGAIALGMLADRWTAWFHVSSFEGGAGYYVIFHGLFGAIGGFILGVICSRFAVQGAESNFLRGLLLSVGWMAGVLAVLAAGSYLLADFPPRLNGRNLVVEVEVRTPRMHPLLERSGLTPVVWVSSAASKASAQRAVKPGEARQAGDRWVAPATVPLRTSSYEKHLWVSWTNGCSMYFPFAVPGKPTERDFEWSEWREAKQRSLDGDWAQAGVDAGFEARYRVQYEPPPAPEPTASEVEADEEADETAALAAVPADAPLRAWLPFTRPGIAPARQQEALARIAARPQLAAEVEAMALGDHAEEAAEVLRLVVTLPPSTNDWRGAVAAAGRDLARRLEEVVRVPAEEDPAYERAAEISIRFSGWMQAARSLREQAGADFSAELRPILVTARQRPDSHALRQDVVRVASFYLHEWTGEAPLPSDPPPR